MTGGAERRTRRGSLIGQAVVVMLALIAGLAAASFGEPIPGVAAGGGEGDGGNSGPAADPADQPAVVLVGHIGADDRIDMLALYGFPAADTDTGDDAADGGGHVVLVPPSTLVDVPSFGAQPVADIARISSPSLLETSIENAFGIGVDHMALLDDTRRVEVFTAAPEIGVELSRPVLVSDTAGTISWPVGRHEVDGATAVRLLDGETEGGELAHQVTVRAVLEGWRATLTDPAVGTAVAAAEPALTALVSRASTPASYDTLPVDSIGIGEETRFGIRREEAEALIERDLGWARLAGGAERPRVEIRNGVGLAGLTASVAELVVPAGGYVTITGNVEGFGVEQTAVTYHDESDRDAAERLARVVGTDRVGPSPAPVQIVDVTIYVGADFVPPP